MSERLHIRGPVLPDADRAELWVVDGRVTYDRVADATTVGEGFVLPGLVDAHCHVGIDSNGAVPRTSRSSRR
jgi:imidazolonepropionase-like amidohydrolase